MKMNIQLQTYAFSYMPFRKDFIQHVKRFFIEDFLVFVSSMLLLICLPGKCHFHALHKTVF